MVPQNFQVLIKFGLCSQSFQGNHSCARILVEVCSIARKLAKVRKTFLVGFFGTKINPSLHGIELFCQYQRKSLRSGRGSPVAFFVKCSGAVCKTNLVTSRDCKSETHVQRSHVRKYDHSTPLDVSLISHFTDKVPDVDCKNRLSILTNISRTDLL